ncbi:MAG: hypothetical protein HZRFUVUK_001780, partial [Candidatus Fervidibacterota bacterium]
SSMARFNPTMVRLQACDDEGKLRVMGDVFVLVAVDLRLP